MTERERAECNLTEFFMTAQHWRIVAVVEALARELIMRGLDGRGHATDLLGELRRSSSVSRRGT